jgi:hypothetical protein
MNQNMMMQQHQMMMMMQSGMLQDGGDDGALSATSSNKRGMPVNSKSPTPAARSNRLTVNTNTRNAAGVTPKSSTHGRGGNLMQKMGGPNSVQSPGGFSHTQKMGGGAFSPMQGS